MTTKTYTTVEVEFLYDEIISWVIHGFAENIGITLHDVRRVPTPSHNYRVPTPSHNYMLSTLVSVSRYEIWFENGEDQLKFNLIYSQKEINDRCIEQQQSRLGKLLDELICSYDASKSVPKYGPLQRAGGDDD